MSCYCCIVPPQLLDGIANSTHNSDEIRAGARRAFESHVRLMDSRRHHHGAHFERHGAQPTGIVPREVLRHMADSEAVDETTRARARRDLDSLTELLAPEQEALAPTTKTAPNRYVYDDHHTTTLSGSIVRTEGQASVQDNEGNAINEAYDNAGYVLKFYRDIFNWDSIDGKNMDVISTVHYDNGYQNAFWNGKQMVYGDGGELLYNFTGCLDVIGHELSHGVTQYTSPLAYQNQSGALNEHISDVFGIMTKQYTNNTTAEEDDWLIGEGILLPDVKGVALRSMKAPGTAYDDLRLGKDDQPDNMKDYAYLPNDARHDCGGVHRNSGIPNKAFYNAAMAFGGYSWEIAGLVWWKARVSGRIPEYCTFQQFADITVDCAMEIGRDAATAVRQAWVDVGVERAI